MKILRPIGSNPSHSTCIGQSFSGCITVTEKNRDSDNENDNQVNNFCS
jgi:hypothetical protein